MKTILLILLLGSNAVWLVSYHGKVKAMNAKAEALYYENEANDRAATECAQKTGFRYNCADGSQRISCQ
jgi:hypothetical protein